MKYVNIHLHPPLFDTDDVISIPDISSSDISVSHSTLYSSFGIHPWFLTEENATLQFQRLESLLQNDAIIAIGEVGLDAIRDANMSLQLLVFKQIISLSEHYKKPLIIHCVKAYEKLLYFHKRRNVKQPWIIHGFHGNIELVKQLVKRNLFLSFGSKLLQDSKLHSVFSIIPLDSIFLETDNDKINITEIYQVAAEIRNIDVEILKNALYKNFIRVFF